MFSLEELIKATRAKLINKSDKRLISGVSTDSRSICNNDVFFALEGANFDGHDFVYDAVKHGASAIVVSKTIQGIVPEVNILKVQNTTLALGQLAKYHRKNNQIPLIAITGSTGKTTTKDIAACVLSKDYNVLKNIGTYNNHIGVPQTILKLKESHDVCVLELGTNHFGEIANLGNIVQPQIAVITNIGVSHLEFFKDLEGVFKEKKSVINFLNAPRIVLLNGDDNFLRKIKLPKKFKIFYFGIKRPCDFSASDISLVNNKVKFIFNKRYEFSLRTLGRFNVYNALAGIGCGLILGLDIKKIKEALYNFEFPKSRLNKIDFSKFSIIDDTYNSNPLSLKEAINSFVSLKTKGKKILVMGDMLELGKQSAKLHKQIGSFVVQKPIDMFITLGDFSRQAAKAAKSKASINREICSFDSKANLIDFLKSRINQGDILLIKGSRLLKMEEIVSSLGD